MDIFDLDKKYQEHFDVVLEYTCFCAIDPKNRINYIKMVHEILKNNGEFVCLLFPVDKKLSQGGPPFAIDLEPTIELISKFLILIKREVSPLTIKPRIGSEEFLIFRKYGNKN